MLLLCDVLALGVLLWCISDGEPCSVGTISLCVHSIDDCYQERKRPTRWKRVLQLVCLVGILENEGVEVSLAADLELDLVGASSLLDARGCGCMSV